MADPLDPADPVYRSNPANWVFVNGRWQVRNVGNPYGSAGPSTAEASVKEPGESDDAFYARTHPHVSAETVPKGTISAGTPGSELDVSGAEAERNRLSPLLEQLGRQAQSGSGAWEQALRAGTGQANAAAMALGQSQPGMSNQTELRNIANAQAANAQRAVGQANQLRAQQQMHATEALGSNLGASADLDAQQAAAAAAARQARLEANTAAAKVNEANTINQVTGFGQTLASAAGMSKGGAVPGKAEVFGDDEDNDTVPAYLSPGEVVIPRHITQSAHAPERAAEFVRAVQAKHGVQHFDDGGQVADSSVTGVDPLTTLLGGPQQTAASIGGGGLLDTGAYENTKRALLTNVARQQEQAAGRGPSLVPQQMQNATDTAIASAMGQQTGARGPQTGAGVFGASEGIQGAAGTAGERKGEEQARGQAAVSQAILAQRARELALAKAKQQAAWRNTMMNAGIGMDQQRLYQNILGGAGQGAASYAGASGGKDSGDQGWGADEDKTGGSIDAAFNAAHGGEVPDPRAKDFLAALSRRR
jgi:hypothetical protein